MSEVTDIGIAKTIECVIFVISLMIWGGFLVFIVAAYKMSKQSTELDELRGICSIREVRIDKLLTEQRELRTELYRRKVDTDRIISMFRDEQYTIGYEPNTSMGQIARAARLHWLQVLELRSKNHEH